MSQLNQVPEPKQKSKNLSFVSQTIIKLHGLSTFILLMTFGVLATLMLYFTYYTANYSYFFLLSVVTFWVLLVIPCHNSKKIIYDYTMIDIYNLIFMFICLLVAGFFMNLVIIIFIQNCLSLIEN